MDFFYRAKAFPSFETFVVLSMPDSIKRINHFNLSFAGKCPAQVKSLMEGALFKLYEEFSLHFELFNGSSEYLFDYNERAYLSMFCHAYLKHCHNHLEDVLIIQEYVERKRDERLGRVDAVICEKITKNAFIIEAKLYRNTDKIARPSDYSEGLQQLEQYSTKELGLNKFTIIPIVLVFGPIPKMSDYREAYKNYEIDKDSPTDFYALFHDNDKGLEVYGTVPNSYRR